MAGEQVMGFAWVRRLFATWTEFAEYLVIMIACVGGIGGVPWWVAIVGPSVLLLLLGWPGWRGQVAKAARLDREWIELGMPWRARNLALVLGGNFLNNCFFTALAFAFGHLLRWVWFT